MKVKMKVLLVIILFFILTTISVAQEVKPPTKNVDQKIPAVNILEEKVIGEVVGSTEKIVKGAPFSAEAITESIQTLGDGNRITRRTTTKTYRDSQGRFRREESVQLGGNIGSVVEVTPTILIIDPTINSKYFIYPGSKTIQRVDWKMISNNDFKIKRDSKEAFKINTDEKFKIGDNQFELKNKVSEQTRSSQSQNQNGQSNSNNKAVSNEQIAERKARIKEEITETRAELRAEKARVAKIVAEFESKKSEISTKEIESTIKEIEGFKKEIEKAKRDIQKNIAKMQEVAQKGEVSAGELEVVKNEAENFKHEIEKTKQEVQETIDKMKESIRKEETKTNRFSNENVVTESLGVQNIEGIEAEGTRSTHTIKTGEIGNELPIKIVYEKWYSKDLQTIVMSKHFDPRFGENTYRLTNIKRTEPDISLFTLPTDYRIINDKKPVKIDPKTPKEVNSPRVSKPRANENSPNPKTPANSPKPTANETLPHPKISNIEKKPSL